MMKCVIVNCLFDDRIGEILNALSKQKTQLCVFVEIWLIWYYNWKIIKWERLIEAQIQIQYTNTKCIQFQDNVSYTIDLPNHLKIIIHSFHFQPTNKSWRKKKTDLFCYLYIKITGENNSALFIFRFCDQIKNGKLPKRLLTEFDLDILFVWPGSSRLVVVVVVCFIQSW